ncbi:MAG: SRPBCC family protein [Elusimicrobiota bacterium]
MITKGSIIIKESFFKVYAVACDIEHQHEFIPGYEPAVISKTNDGKMVIQRTAALNKKKMTWKSTAEFAPNKFILFKQIEGRLKGMEIEWLFDAVDEGTMLTITHTLRLNIPIIGRFIETYIAKPAIDKLTSNVLKGLKNKMEK